MDKRNVEGVLILNPSQKWITAVDGASELREEISLAIEDGCLAIAVDMGQVEYADSTAIGALIQGFKDLTRNGGRICLFNVGQEMKDFLTQTVLDRFIEVKSDEEAVLLDFKSAPKKKKSWWRPF
jgi:anti-sigma B factor antagonist